MSTAITRDKWHVADFFGFRQKQLDLAYQMSGIILVRDNKLIEYDIADS